MIIIKKLKKLKIIFLNLLVFLILFSVPKVFSQSYNPYSSTGAHYNVKKGEQMQFIYSKIIDNNKNYLQQQLTLANDSKIIYNLSQGSVVTISITNVNKSQTGADQIYSQETFAKEGKATYTCAGSFYIPKPFLTFAFDNKTMVNKFVEFLLNTTSHSYQSYSATSDANFIYADYSESFPNDTYYVDVSYNWHSGWVNNYESKLIAQNGTVLYDIHIQNNSSNFISDLITFPGIVLIFILPVSIIAVVVYELTKYRKIKNNTSLNDLQSFLTFVIEKFKFSMKKRNFSQENIDKSLNMIDEIIKETKEGRE